MLTRSDVLNGFMRKLKSIVWTKFENPFLSAIDRTRDDRTALDEYHLEYCRSSGQEKMATLLYHHFH